MASYHAVQEPPCSNPDICDIVSPPNNDMHVFDSFNSPGDSQNSSNIPHSSYVIPGYNPHLIPQPDAPGTVHWSSPTDEIYYENPGQGNEASGYYPNGNFDHRFNQVSKFESDSSSSVSSANGQNQRQAPVAVSSGGVEKSTTKPKKQRGKVLNEIEAELINKDDSLLTEDELVIKRKAQNRLAQRAFRERKESKLKDLQSKLLESEGERQRLLDALDEIKSQFISLKTENQVLRTSSSGQNNGVDKSDSKFTFPQSQEAFVEEMMTGQDHQVNNDTVSKIYDEPQHPGKKVLAVGAVWDYLSMKIEEEEYENIDMVEVMSNLRGNEVCHGYGPAYPLKLVDAALQRVADQHYQ